MNKPPISRPTAEFLEQWLKRKISLDNRGLIGMLNEFAEAYAASSSLLPVRPTDDDKIYDLSERIQQKIYDLWNRPSDFGQAQVIVRQAIFDELVAFRAAGGRGRKDDSSLSERRETSNLDNAGSTPAVPSNSGLPVGRQLEKCPEDQSDIYKDAWAEDTALQACEYKHSRALHLMNWKLAVLPVGESTPEK